MSLNWIKHSTFVKNYVVQVMAVNKSLVQQIDALRMRLQVDTKQHETTRSAMARETQDKLRMKDSQIEELKEFILNTSLATNRD